MDIFIRALGQSEFLTLFVLSVTSEINSTAKLLCLLLPMFISDLYFVDKISQFRLGGNSQKSQQKP
jgi:hypothetical protein